MILLMNAHATIDNYVLINFRGASSTTPQNLRLVVPNDKVYDTQIPVFVKKGMKISFVNFKTKTVGWEIDFYPLS